MSFSVFIRFFLLIILVSYNFSNFLCAFAFRILPPNGYTIVYRLYTYWFNFVEVTVINLFLQMDDSPFRQTFELEIFISAAEKTILNFVNSDVWLQNIVKCEKYSPVKVANFVCFCIMPGKVYQISKCDYASAHNTKVYKIFKLQKAIFSTCYSILQPNHRMTKLHHFTKFRILFPNERDCKSGIFYLT